MQGVAVEGVQASGHDEMKRYRHFPSMTPQQQEVQTGKPPAKPET